MLKEKDKGTKSIKKEPKIPYTKDFDVQKYQECSRVLKNNYIRISSEITVFDAAIRKYST